MSASTILIFFFFFTNPATPQISTLSLHDALPIFVRFGCSPPADGVEVLERKAQRVHPQVARSEEHTSELQSHSDLVCRLLLEKKKASMRRTLNRTSRKYNVK